MVYQYMVELRQSDNVRFNVFIFLLRGVGFHTIDLIH